LQRRRGGIYLQLKNVLITLKSSDFGKNNSNLTLALLEHISKNQLKRRLGYSWLRRLNMLFKKSERKSRHPYATLAIFTLAGASMVNLVNKTKRFFKSKMDAVMGLVDKMKK